MPDMNHVYSAIDTDAPVITLIEIYRGNAIGADVDGGMYGGSVRTDGSVDPASWISVDHYNVTQCRDAIDDELSGVAS